MKRESTYRQQSPAFGAWLLSEIKAAGMTQGEFAEKVGVSRTTVSRWVKGRIPDGVFIDPIADVLLLDYDEVSERAGYRPRLSSDDLDAVHARLDPRLRRVEWSEFRYGLIESVLDQFYQDDELKRSSAPETSPQELPASTDARTASDTR